VSEAMRIVVIGGSAAGPKAAAKARRMDQNADITIVQKGKDLSMASCGYPYYVGGFFDDRNELLCTPTGVIRDPKFFMNAKGITALTETEALEIDRGQHSVRCRRLADGQEFRLPYDKLILATGAVPIFPPVPGTDLKGITTLQSMEDADYLRHLADDGKTHHAVIVGGGLIGIETCEALQLAGIQITVVELLPQLLTFLDWELAKLVENHVREKGANVITQNPVAEFLGENGVLTGVKLRNGTELPCELAVVATGVRPNTALAEACGLEIGARRGIVVDEYLQTSDPDIYAVGDCIQIMQLLTGKPVHAPYGDLANLQGRVAAQNAVLGNRTVFPGTIQTGICKVFDFSAGCTGLSETSARANGFENIETVVTATLDKPMFMGAKLLVMKLVADRESGRLLGCQCIGPGDVSKRIAEAAMAIHGRLTVSDLVNADLPYAPPFSPAIDNLPTSAHVLENKMLGRMKGISAVELKRKLDAGETPFLLDTRGPDEYEAMRLGIGETLIPLGALRGRLNELPADTDAEIICFCKISLRGYEAASLIESRGWTDVKVLEGGIMAWPFAREK
jgi:NADPH-dependent 2,4-dienoyl-CoA reductase/sulfur reductase-like enzyme/rhodanese-related sulfurtransferase